MITTSVEDTVRLVRLYTDDRSGRYVSTDEIRTLIVEEWQSSIWPRVVQRSDAWYATTATSAVTSGVSTVAVPGDMHRPKRLVLVWSDTEREDVTPLSERERAHVQSLTWSRGGPKRYQMQGDSAHVLPLPGESCVAQWVYLPTPSETEIAGPEAARKCVALQAAIMLRGMQDEPTDVLERRLAVSLSELDQQAGRYHDEPARVIDVHPEGSWYPEDERYLPRP